MSLLHYPIFLDIEASGLVIESYPIEIAWNDASGEITSFLITPVSEWTYWSIEAEHLHRIKHEELNKNGISIHEACDRLDAVLSGSHIYSDAPYYERQWLDKLYDTAGRKRPFTVKGISDIKKIYRNFELNDGQSNYERFMEQAFKELGDQHRATVDVKALMRAYQLCHEA